MYFKPGHRFSHQYHNNRSEFGGVVSGKVTLNGKVRMLSVGDSISVPRRAKHRIEGIEKSVVLEIAYGKQDENDIVRLADDYGRA